MFTVMMHVNNYQQASPCQDCPSDGRRRRHGPHPPGIETGGFVRRSKARGESDAADLAMHARKLVSWLD